MGHLKNLHDKPSQIKTMIRLYLKQINVFKKLHGKPVQIKTIVRLLLKQRNKRFSSLRTQLIFDIMNAQKKSICSFYSS